MESRSFQDSEPQAGVAYWVTGLPGVGRKTLASRLASDLRARDQAVVQLDGDRVRRMLGERFGYGLADRHVLAQAYGRLCAELAGQGLNVVFSTVSMFHDVRRWNLANIDRYREIYLQASPQLLAERHPKGLYAAALAGRIRQVVGVDLPMEAPEAPDVRVDVARHVTPEAVAAQVIGALSTLPTAGHPSLEAAKTSS